MEWVRAVSRLNLERMIARRLGVARRCETWMRYGEVVENEKSVADTAWKDDINIDDEE